MVKRDDLQWLRALAIIAVLSFHMHPKSYPYGYLGVDIFFVISGYLMTTILSKPSDILTFYLRRIKRIFPIYFLIITVFFGIGYFKLLQSHFQFLKTEILWSILFVNNFLPMFQKKEYFQMISEFKFFLHTWSVSLEIQYYLIAPFLINFILSKKHPLYWTLLIMIFSFVLQNFYSNDAVAFGLMFCRTWQFLMGTFTFLLESQKCVAFLLTDQVKETTDKAPKINNAIALVTLLFLLLICFFTPYSFLSISYLSYIFRLSSTIITGAFISTNFQPFFIFYYVNPIFAYIGDMSYIVYLIHWPIILFLKYFHIDYGDIFTLLCIFTPALAIHECFEKPFKKLSLACTKAVIFICCIIIIVLCFCENEKGTTIFNPIHENEKETSTCSQFYYDNSCEISPLLENYSIFMPPREGLDRYCSFTLSSKSNKTIMITGNSYIFFQIRGILDAIKQSKTQFSEAYVVTHPYCNVLAGDMNKIYPQICKNIDIFHEKLLNATRPDIIIYSGRIDHLLPTTASLNFESDHFYHEIKKSILLMAKFTRRLIIVEPYPPFNRTGYAGPLNVAQMLLVDGATTQFDFPVQEFRKAHDPSWNRIKKAVKYCPNCVIVPTQKIMCPTDVCPMVDPISQVALFCDKAHMTPRQSLKLIPNIIKAIDEENPIPKEYKHVSHVNN